MDILIWREFIHLGKSKLMKIPPNVLYKKLVKQLTRKCGEPIELFSMTKNDLLPVIDDKDLKVILKKSYIILYCQ